MKKYIFLLFILFFSVNAFAANHYIRAGAAGANDGSSWTNAWTTFGAVTWTRGDTYYVAGGTYNENISIPARSGTSWITIKKANATDNGSDPRWDSSYATNQAVITGSFIISSSYVEVNGVTGLGTSGHGIKISNSPIYATLLLTANTTSHYLRHIEVQGIGFRTNSAASGIYQNSSNTSKNLHIAYCWVHDTPGNGVVIGYMVGTNYSSDYGMLFENNVVSEVGGGYLLDARKHAQGMQIGYAKTDTYLIIRNNTFRNIVSQGPISYLGSGTHSNSLIYNNLFYQTDLTTYPSIASLIFWHTSSRSVANMYFYNNTVYNYGSSDGSTESTNCTAIKTPYSCCTGRGTGCRVKAYQRQEYASATNVEYKNNIWVSSYFPAANVGATASLNNGGYNNWGRGSPTATETADPFVNSAGYDFHLKSTAYAVNSGADLSAFFTTDKDGTIRPQGIAWDIGAYEYKPLLSGSIAHLCAKFGAGSGIWKWDGTAWSQITQNNPTSMVIGF